MIKLRYMLFKNTVNACNDGLLQLGLNDVNIKFIAHIFVLLSILFYVGIIFTRKFTIKKCFVLAGLNLFHQFECEMKF